MKSMRYALLIALALMVLSDSVLLLYQPSVRASAGTPQAEVLTGGRADSAHTSFLSTQGSRAIYSASVVASFVTESVEQNVLLFEGVAFIFAGFFWRRRSRAKTANVEV
jgi:hypothetical protein